MHLIIYCSDDWFSVTPVVILRGHTLGRAEGHSCLVQLLWWHCLLLGLGFQLAPVLEEKLLLGYTIGCSQQALHQLQEVLILWVSRGEEY